MLRSVFFMTSLLVLTLACAKREYFYQPDRSEPEGERRSPVAVVPLRDEKDSIQVAWLGLSGSRVVHFRFAFDYRQPGEKSQQVRKSPLRFDPNLQVLKISGVEIHGRLSKLVGHGEPLFMRPGPTQILDVEFALPPEIGSFSEIRSFKLQGQVTQGTEVLSFSKKFTQTERPGNLPTGNSSLAQDHHDRVLKSFQEATHSPTIPTGFQR